MKTLISMISVRIEYRRKNSRNGQTGKCTTEQDEHSRYHQIQPQTWIFCIFWQVVLTGNAQISRDRCRRNRRKLAQAQEENFRQTENRRSRRCVAIVAIVA